MEFCKRRKTNSPRDEPDTLIHSTELPRQYFELTDNEEDERFADLSIVGDVFVYPIDDGKREYDIEMFELPRIKKFDGLEEDIREHYFAWLAHARAFTRERADMRRVVDKICEMARKDDDI